jgi:hypothetical protein
VNCEFPTLHVAKVDLLFELGLLFDTNLLIFLWIIKAWPQCLFINEVSALCFREEYASRLIERVYGIILFIVLVPFWRRPIRRSLLGERSTKGAVAFSDMLCPQGSARPLLH